MRLSSPLRCLVCLCLFMSAAAHAQLVTIDPSAYSTGTNLFSVFPGARVFTLTNEDIPGRFVVGQVVPVANTWAPGGGTNFFGHVNPYPRVVRTDFRNVFDFEFCLDGCGPVDFFNPLIVSFLVPTNFVEVRVHFLPEDIDGTILRAYNSRGELLDTCRFWGSTVTPRAPQLGTYPTPTSPICGEEVRRYDCYRKGECKIENLGRIRRAYPDIAYIAYGGESFSSTRSAISHVTFRRYSESCPP